MSAAGLDPLDHRVGRRRGAGDGEVLEDHGAGGVEIAGAVRLGGAAAVDVELEAGDAAAAPPPRSSGLPPAHRHPDLRHATSIPPPADSVGPRSRAVGVGGRARSPVATRSPRLHLLLNVSRSRSGARQRPPSGVPARPWAVAGPGSRNGTSGPQPVPPAEWICRTRVPYPAHLPQLRTWRSPPSVLDWPGFGFKILKRHTPLAFK